MLSARSSHAAAHSCAVALALGIIACGSSDSGDFFGSAPGGSASGGSTTGGQAGAPTPIGGSSIGGSSVGGSSVGGTSLGGSSVGGTTAGDAGSSSANGGSTAGGGATGNGGNAGTPSSAGSGGSSSPAGGAGSGGTISAGTGGMPLAGSTAVAGTGGTAPCESSQEICDGVDNDCDEQVDEGRSCASGCEGFTSAERGYMYCSMANTLNQASQLCEAEGMHLAWIETEAENTALLEALSELVMLPGPGGPDPGVRIGATDAEDEGEWSWIDGPAFWDGNVNGEAVDDAFTNWASDSPNNGNGSFSGQNCAVLLVENGPDGRAGEWNDVRCTQVQPFVCELP